MKTHTISEQETHNLATLARLSLTEAEHTGFRKDIESILGFIDTIQDVSAHDTPLQQAGFAPIGVVRDDMVAAVPNSTSASQIVGQSPSHADNSIKVKKIIAQ